MKTNFLIVGCLLFFMACQHKEQDVEISIDLESAIDKRDITQIKYLNDIAEVQHIIPVETNDSSLLVYASIAVSTPEYIGVYDKRVFFLVDKRNGKISHRISKMGNGPGEYTRISKAVLDDEKRWVYILDSTTGKLCIYSYDGHFIKEIKQPVDHFNFLSEGGFVVTHSSRNKSDYRLTIYDSDWNFKRNGLPREKHGGYAMIYFDGTSIYNNKVYFRTITGDTMYHITADQEKPYLLLHRGRYKMPDEYKKSLDKMNQEGPNFIQSEGLYIASNYLFIRYLYNRSWFYDIWDISNSTLLYRSVYSEDSGQPGIPLLINDKEIRCWPSFVDGNSIYCDIEEVQTLFPDLPEDNNPLIIELKIKEN